MQWGAERWDRAAGITSEQVRWQKEQLLVPTQSKSIPKNHLCFAGKAVLRAVMAITPGKALPRHGRGDNVCCQHPGGAWDTLAGCHQHELGACCLAAWPIPPCTRKKQTQRGGCKKLKRPEDRKCQNPGCPLSLALAELRVPAGKEHVFHLMRGNMPCSVLEKFRLWKAV